MKKREDRAARARELAEWFRGIGGDEAGGLMARTAHALDQVAQDETVSETPHLAITAPVAANDNAKASRRRIRR